MSEQLQWLAERYARLAERLALLEAGSNDFPSGYITGNTLVPGNGCLVACVLEVLDGYSFELASGATLVLVG